MAQRPGLVGRRTSPSIATYEELRDPGLGEKLPRCAVCGVPEERELVGEWAGRGVFRLRVCPNCIARWNRLDPDPLDATEAA